MTEVGTGPKVVSVMEVEGDTTSQTLLRFTPAINPTKVAEDVVEAGVALVRTDDVGTAMQDTVVVVNRTSA